MKKLILTFISVTSLFLVINLVNLPAKANTNNTNKLKVSKIKIVATTTHISTILTEIGRDKVEIINLVPGGMCPGHFDIAPQTVKNIAEANLILYHGWEKWINKVIEINPKLQSKKVQVNTQGNWLVPEINLSAAKELLEILIKTDPDNESYYTKNYLSYKNSIKQLSTEIERYKKKYSGIKVICSLQQKEFVSYLGFKILSEYNRIEDMTLQELKNIVSIGKKEKVVLVIDNLQSGPNTGNQIAKDLGAKHVVLTNFPTDLSYVETVKYNINILNKALGIR
jgi:zinc transport system substrate-binding protein